MTIKDEIDGLNELHKTEKNFPKRFIYPFFLVHMAGFGFSGFAISYGSDSAAYLFGFLHGGIAIFVYLAFYIAIFGIDKVKDMIIGAFVGISGVIARLNKIVNFGRGNSLSDYSPFASIVPGAYFILYSFLIRHIFIDIFKSFVPEQAHKFGNILFFGTGLASSLIAIFS